MISWGDIRVISGGFSCEVCGGKGPIESDPLDIMEVSLVQLLNFTEKDQEEEEHEQEAGRSSSINPLRRCSRGGAQPIGGLTAHPPSHFLFNFHTEFPSSSSKSGPCSGAKCGQEQHTTPLERSPGRGLFLLRGGGRKLTLETR